MTERIKKPDHIMAYFEMNQGFYWPTCIELLNSLAPTKYKSVIKGEEIKINGLNVAVKKE